MGMVENAIGLTIAAIVIAGITIPLIGDILVLHQNTATNETFNATADPFTYTANDASNSNFYELASVTCYSDAGSTSLADSACNITDASAGTIKLSTTVDAGDEAVDYTWNPENYVENDTSRVVLGFVVVGAAVGLLLAAFSFGR